MRQIIQMFLIDVRMSMKSFMGAYIVTVPLVILFVLRIFLHTVETTSATIAVVTEGPGGGGRTSPSWRRTLRAIPSSPWEPGSSAGRATGRSIPTAGD